MAAKSKKILLQNLNTFVLDTILSIKEDNEGISAIELRKRWESSDFQKKMAVEVFGIKSKTLTPGPKRNKSAYMFFCQDMRPKIVADNPNCKPHEVMSLLGCKWREDLTMKQKCKYYEQAAEDKERYLDMKEVEKRRNKAPCKLSSYFLFCEDERPIVKKEFPNMKTKKVTAECGKRWNDIKINDPERYKCYVEKAAK